MKKQDLRVKRTKQSFKRAILELLAKKSIEDITIREITELAVCNKNTFYLHYRDKYDLMEKICASTLYELETTMNQAYVEHYNSKEEWYLDIAKRSLDAVELDMSFYVVVLGYNKYPEFADKFRTLIVKFLCSGTGQNGIELKFKRFEAEYSSSGVVGAIQFWLKNQSTYTKNEIVAQMSNLVIGVGSVILG